ncbi:MAG: aryl-sulfate sulfohydrolase [Verrucomicrobiales bacterium]|nr:aryl-sulfate sulfohydrolase [Verrucomicrobiales bacterium]|tara:strand:- start:9248 stop:10717 length:1470 start_codon:yes stop_codon:yes gene_type:complete
MKNSLILLLIALGTSTLTAKTPNILFIFLDDFGWRDTSYMGSDFYETPNLDKLASEGMVFTDAYACAANCAPSRACLLSGQYTPRHEIYNVGTKPRGNSQHRRLEHIPGKSTLDPNIKTWAQSLKEAGYITATMGKWHLSEDPLPYGFDLNVGGTHSGSPPRGYYPPHPRAPELQDVPDDEYLTDSICNRAVQFIRANQDNKWALYLTLFAVHTPLNAKKELAAKYKSKMPGDLHNHVAMATMVQAVDDGVGRIVATLKKLNLSKNTVVFFFSDNGGYGPATDMAPLKGYKGTYYEGGIRVPFFVKWPGVIKPGSRTSEPMIGVDLHPTFREIAGARTPGQAKDGLSLVPFLKGDTEHIADRALFWHFPAYLQSYQVIGEQRDPLFRSRPCSIIRRGDWKLHHYLEDDAHELYNLKDDIGESNNLAGRMPGKVAQLRNELDAWRSRVKAAMPRRRNPEFDAQAETVAIKAMLKRMEGQAGNKKKQRTKP